MTVPKLRFNEFDSNWDLKKISYFVKSLDAGVSVNSEEGKVKESSYTILKTSCVSNGYFNQEERKAVTNTQEISRLKEQLLDDSIIISRMNTPQLVGASAYVKTAPKNTFLPDRLWQVKLDSNKANMSWFSYWLNTERNYLKIRDLATGTSNSMKNITKPDLLALEVFLPTPKEQSKIANFLTAVDEKISLLSQKTNLLAQYKKGVMQKIFSQELRFKDDDGREFPEWDLVELEKVATKVNKKNKDLSINNVLTNSATQGIVSQSDYFDRDIANQNNLGGYYIVETDDFVYNPRISANALVGPIKRNHLTIGVMSPLYTVFRFTKGNLNFYEQYFQTNHWHDYMKSISNTGARHDRMNITNESFFGLPLPCPVEKEQLKIANFLIAIDDKVSQTQAELNAVTQYKQGLLQQMFV